MYTEDQIDKMLDEIFIAIDSVDALVAVAAETTFGIVRSKLRKMAKENCDHSVGVCYCSIIEELDRDEFTV